MYGTVDISGRIHPGTYSGWHFTRHVVEPLRRIVRIHYPGGPFLDAGCGNGQISQVVAGCGVDPIVGVDFSRPMLDAAVRRARAGGYIDRFRLVRMNLDDLDVFPENHFSMSLLFGVIEHLDHPDRVLRHLMRITRPEGALVLGVPRKFSPAYFSYLAAGRSPRRWGEIHRFRDLFRFREKLDYYRFCSPGEIRDMLRRAGPFRVLETVPFARLHLDGWPGAVLRTLGRNPNAGHRVLDRTEHLLARMRVIPAGEYWVIRKPGTE